MGDKDSARLIDCNNNRRDRVNLRDFFTSVTANGTVVQIASGKGTATSNDPVVSPSRFSIWLQQAKDVTKLLPVVVFMAQLFGFIALLMEICILLKDFKWNQAMEGWSTLNFPSKRSLSIPNMMHVNFDDGGDQLWKHLLRRNLCPSIAIVVVLIALGIFNVIRHKYFRGSSSLPWFAASHFVFGIILMLLGVYQHNVTSTYISTNYRAMTASLTNFILPPDYFVPSRVPDEDPIHVKGNVAYFFQVFKSCQKGNTEYWERQNYLRGLSSRFTVPTFRQLVNAGFCVDSWVLCCPFLTLVILVGHCWSVALLCALIKKRQAMAVAQFNMEGRGGYITEDSSVDQSTSPKKLTRKFKNAASDLMQYKV